MGFLNALFGGGTKLELKLDTNQVPEGGILSGTAFLTGGKKPLTLTALKVWLAYVKVELTEGSALPKVDMRYLIDNTISSNQSLAPGSLTKYPFTLTIPKGTDPSGTYKVTATADIPGVIDPSADADLKVMPAQQRSWMGFAKGAEASDADSLYERFPGLKATGDEFLDALNDLRNAAYDPEENLVVAEPILARALREGDARTRREALRTWGTVLNNRARPEHIKTLEAIAADPQSEERLLWDVTEVAAKFAEEGALPLVKQLMKHPVSAVRAQLATNLYLNADRKLKERKGLLMELARDQAPEVRAAAVGAFGDFYEQDASLVQLVAQILREDPAAVVKAAALRCLSYASHYSSPDFVYAQFLEAVNSPLAEVRQEMADVLSSLPDDPRLEQLVGKLLSDGDAGVRRRTAWQGYNLSEHKVLAPMFLKAATSDAVVEVRGDALQGLSRLLPLSDALAVYQERLAKDQAEVVYWGVVNGLRDFKAEPPAKAMLQQIATGGMYSGPARAAREILEG